MEIARSISSLSPCSLALFICRSSPLFRSFLSCVKSPLAYCPWTVRTLFDVTHESRVRIKFISIFYSKLLREKNTKNERYKFKENAIEKQHKATLRRYKYNPTRKKRWNQKESKKRIKPFPFHLLFRVWRGSMKKQFSDRSHLLALRTLRFLLPSFLWECLLFSTSLIPLFVQCNPFFSLPSLFSIQEPSVLCLLSSLSILVRRV